MNQNRRQGSKKASGSRTIQIPVRPPYDWNPIIRFLQPRAIPGLETVNSQSYKRAFRIGSTRGLLEVRPSVEEHCLDLTLPPGPRSDLDRITASVARLFDCNADPMPIYGHLSRQTLLTSIVALDPGIRVPGAFDGFEIAVRAVLGQQITVRAATTMSGRLVACYGSPLEESESGEIARLFPASEVLVRADLTRIGLTRAKARAIAGLAEAHLSEPALFEPSSDPAASIARLMEIPGVGQWTAQYIAMRALKHPDGFPASDLGLRRAVSGGGNLVSSEELEEQSSAWRPWRAYAAMHLWASLV
ncbi:MAG TPA: DNA-3-methyladenine glycosylase [Blastocatellia bacterium]|nr:DNA-3-methyladenine glycosylase [Blastocatellia bacterium]